MQKVRSICDQIVSPKSGARAPLEPVDYTYGRLYEESASTSINLEQNSLRWVCVQAPVYSRVRLGYNPVV